MWTNGLAMPKSSSCFAAVAMDFARSSRWDSRASKALTCRPHLVSQYQGNATCYVCDCRQLPFADQSKDALIVQGGLHHLLSLPDDLEQTLAQMHRVLRKDGRVVLVEPWLTPFLRLAHFACESRNARRLSNKVDALAVMIQHERQTYEQWLSQPEVILQVVRKHFVPIQQSVAWGKWSFVGKPV